MKKKPAIKVKNLKKYFDKTKAVDGVSFDVREGEIMGFLGPNGAGKTTTIKCLLNFYNPTAGDIRILGNNPETDLLPIQQNVGYLSAENNLYEEWTGREHINLLKKIRGGAPSEDDLIARLDYDPSKKVKNLSTGNRQKLALVLALMHNPKLMILDEPTSGLDPLLQQVIYEILKERVENGDTVFISSHNLAEVEQICDRVVIINKGHIEAIESIAKIQEKKVYNVFVYFEDKVPDNLDKKNLDIVRKYSDGVEILYKGDIMKLLGILDDYNIRDLQIAHSPLEKIFLEYYKNK